MNSTPLLDRHASLLRVAESRDLSVHDPGTHADDAGWFARHEMARILKDVPARRTRLLFLDSRAALARSPQIARELAQAPGRNEAGQQAQLAAFQPTAAHYLIP